MFMLLYYYYRRYLGWLPVQFCMMCSKPYWGGLPRFWVVKKWEFAPTPKTYRWRLACTWQASWREYCSKECNDDSHNYNF